ncbi:MAG: Universal stress protein [Nitrososphaeraceae archaeon]|nr:Universal stress protein [Nitrososphaeraceae archaeon]MDF2770412.1 Universal stress protein [Nitrososphaeraceae archaeon]
MRNFSKILVAIDGSEISMKAAVYTIDIVKKNKSQLIALTVLDISTPRRISSSFITAPTYGLKELEEKRKEAQQWLDKFEKLAAKENNVKFKSEIIEDPISRVGSSIVTYAERENVDLIVIGSRGRTGFKKMLLGSVASDVVTYAHCPVMVVK